MNDGPLHRLERQLVAVVLACLLLPTLAMGWLGYREAYTGIRNEKIRNVGRIADSRRTELVTILQRTNARVAAFLVDMGMRCADASDGIEVSCANQALQSFAKSEKSLGATLRLPGGSDITAGIANVRPDAWEPFRLGQLARFSERVAGQERTYAVLVHDQGHGARLLVTFPVGLLQGLFVNAPDLGRSGETFLADGDGFFITTPRYASVQGHSHPISARPMQACLVAENREVLDQDYRDVAIIHGFRFIPEIGSGCIMAHVDQAEAFAPLRALTWRMGVVALLFTVAASIAAIAIGRRIARPIERLTQAIGEIIAGNYQTRAELSGNNEITELTRSFNRMAERLQMTLGELEAQNAQLEQQVRDRTVEIAHRQVLEADLKASGERLRPLSRAVEQSPNMIFITDLHGTIEYVNPRFCLMSGYSEAEAIGAAPRILKSEDTPAVIYQNLWDTVLSGNDWRGDLKDRRKDGQVFWASVSISPVRDDHGALTHFVAMHQDITERKLAEESIRLAKEEAELASRAKSEILANMSHELRTPLNAVIGFSETLLSGVFGSAPNSKYTEYLNDIRASGSHLLEVINDVLDVSAIEAGKLTLNEQSLDVAEILGAAMRLILPRAEAGKVIVTTDVPAAVPNLHADERRVKQVLLNLLSNAVKFTPEGGAVTATARLTAEGRIEIAVADTGIGMDAAGIEKALTTFGQVDSGLARRHEGTGLGLPLVQGLMQLHGGTLALTSEKGAGTTVVIAFPASRVMVPVRPMPALIACFLVSCGDLWERADGETFHS